MKEVGESWEKWSRDDYVYGEGSARSMPINYPVKMGLKCYRLVHKIIMPINECLHCSSDNTYHKHIQDNSDVTDNVWRSEELTPKRSVGSGHRRFRKWDYCFDCYQEFLIEMFCFKKISWITYFKIKLRYLFGKED